MGGSIDNFTGGVRRDQPGFDHKGTRFITVDTSAVVDQGQRLDPAADAATRAGQGRADRGVGSVALIQHVPLRDPTPAKASELNDRKEAAVIESWLSDFQRSTGKGAVFIGAHVGTFHAAQGRRRACFVNGNSAKAPSTAPTEGGFTGWSRWGVDPITAKEADAARATRPATRRRGWPRRYARTSTRSAWPLPDELEAGRVGRCQGHSDTGRRTFPVGYPMTAAWSGSPNVLVGDWSDRKPWHTAVLDPDTGTLTGDPRVLDQTGRDGERCDRSRIGRRRGARSRLNPMCGGPTPRSPT